MFALEKGVVICIQPRLSSLRVKNVTIRLVSLSHPKVRRQLGAFRDQIWIADDFDAPLPDNILAAFEGKSPKKKRKAKQT